MISFRRIKYGALKFGRRDISTGEGDDSLDRRP